MKRFVIPFTFIFFSLLSFSFIQAQTYKIQGKLVDEHRVPIELAQIAFSATGTAKPFTTQTAKNGNFLIHLPAKNYKVQIFFMGSLLKEDQITVRSQTDLGVITTNKTVVLDSVVVRHQGNVLEQKIDRIVFNVEKSIAAQGMDLTEALTYAPMVQVGESNISIVGRNGAAVMINDRMVNLSGPALINYLKTLRSDNIAKIEVITTPPAKYDAQGNGGLINIITKKNTNLGWSGTVGSNYTRRSKNGFGNNITLNYQGEKTSITTSLRQSDSRSFSSGYSNLLATESLLTSYGTNAHSQTWGGSLTLDHALNKRANIGVVLDYVYADADRKKNTELDYLLSNKLDSMMHTDATEKAKTPTFIASAYYDLKLDSTGKKLSILGNYLTTNPKSITDFETNNRTNGNNYVINTDNALNYHIYTGQLDFSLPYQWGFLETGTKYTRFNNNSGLQYFNVVDDGYILVPEKSNDFQYNEDNIALYLSASRNITKLWSAKIGLRYEYTFLEGYSPTLHETNKNNYGNLFPTVYISYKPNPKNTYSLNYSRRINRPSFGQLNPFRSYANPYTYFVGNPELAPSYTDNIDLGYSFNNKFNIFLTARQWKNGNAYLATFEDGYQVNKQENYIDQKSLGGYLYYADRFFKFWNTSSSISLSYMASTTKIEEAVGLKGFNTYFNANNTFLLNKKQTLSLLANYTHFFGNKSGNIENLSNANFTFGGRAAFLNRSLNLTAFVADIFKQDYSRGKGVYQNYEQTYRNYIDVRRFVISASYSFGNKKVKSLNKDTKFSDKSRVD